MCRAGLAARLPKARCTGAGRAGLQRRLSGRARAALWAPRAGTCGQHRMHIKPRDCRTNSSPGLAPACGLQHVGIHRSAVVRNTSRSGVLYWDPFLSSVTWPASSWTWLNDENPGTFRVIAGLSANVRGSVLVARVLLPALCSVRPARETAKDASPCTVSTRIIQH